MKYIFSGIQAVWYKCIHDVLWIWTVPGAFHPGIVDAGTDIVDRPALVASSCGYDFTRIPIQQNVHDAIIH